MLTIIEEDFILTTYTPGTPEYVLLLAEAERFANQHPHRGPHDMRYYLSFWNLDRVQRLLNE